MLDCVNRYQIKHGITIDDILEEIKERKISKAEGGAWINKNSYYCFWETLDGSIEIEVAIPKNLSEWNDFDYVLVMDDDFVQPYTPFYESKTPFRYLLNIVGNYNKFMDSLNFLERKLIDE